MPLTAAVVEDDAFTRTMLVATLRSQGVEVVIETGVAAEALDQARLWRFTADPCGPTDAPVEVPAEQPGSDAGPGPDPDATVGAGEVSTDTSTDTSTARTVRCTPAAPRVGQAVACSLAGGDSSEAVVWRAAYNPTFAEGTVVLDGSGSGVFEFVIPVEALGSPVTVEIVGWGAPVAVAQAVMALVPGSIPAGAGPPSGSGPGVFLGGLVAAVLLLLTGLRRDRPDPDGHGRTRVDARFTGRR